MIAAIKARAHIGRSQLPAPEVPKINFDKLPESERQEANHLAALLHLLDAFVLRFEDALALQDHARELREKVVDQINATELTYELYVQLELPFRWRLMAFRDAALSVYHFASTLRAISRSINLCPSLRKLLKSRPTDGARTIFTKQFPTADFMRHAVAHVADMAERPDTLKFHAVAGHKWDDRYPEFLINNAIGTRLSGNTMHLAHKGKDVSLTLDQHSADELYRAESDLFEQLRLLEK